MEELFLTDGLLENLHTNRSFNDKIQNIHSALKKQFPFIDRIAGVLYDSGMEGLKSFIHSSTDDPVSAYNCDLALAPSLKQLMILRKPRLVNDLDLFKHGINEHTRRIAAHGYGSSYTVPMMDAEKFIGIIFFNSYQKNKFTKECIPTLNLFSKLINCLIVNKLRSIQAMIGAFKSVLNLVSYKDPETGNHLERMARYSRLIAQQLAISGQYPLNDETIEHLFLFAPLHDIGKIGIPDHILLKPGRLNDEEWQIMKTHASKGRDIIDTIVEQMGLQSFEHISLLRNISESHHETIDGKGYPNQLKADEIPIETQIVSVADIFDALTSERSYKPAWSNDDAFVELKKLAGTRLNESCVDILIRERKAVEKIQQTFKD